VKNLKYIDDEDEVEEEEHLFKRPRARQFVYDGALVREREERKALFHELFLDLVFVAVIAKLGENLSGDVSWWGVEQYILLFAPVWRVWADTHFYLNRFDLVDTTTKLVLYSQMLLLIGAGVSSVNCFESSSTLFVSCILLARSVLALLYATYGIFFIPNFRANLLFIVFAMGIPSIFWIAAIFEQGETLRALFWVANLLDAFAMPIIDPLFQWIFKPEFIFALNIEQYVILKIPF